MLLVNSAGMPALPIGARTARAPRRLMGCTCGGVGVCARVRQGWDRPPAAAAARGPARRACPHMCPPRRPGPPLLAWRRPQYACHTACYTTLHDTIPQAFDRIWQDMLRRRQPGPEHYEGSRSSMWPPTAHRHTATPLHAPTDGRSIHPRRYRGGAALLRRRGRLRRCAPVGAAHAAPLGDARALQLYVCTLDSGCSI